jgi:GNAT superfamily N-acetyltransferase
MMEAARLARVEDLDAIEAIAKRGRDEKAQLRGGELFLAREAAWPPVPDRIGAALGDDRSVVVVGTYGDVVFGYATALVEELPDGRRLGVLEELMVEPEARKSGIGEAMMELILDTLRAAGCLGVDSWALPGDRDTKNFFESFGLKARLLRVHRSFE